MGAELNQKLFSAADSLRGKMSADQYKDYLLGLIFYKYLSDKLLESTVVKAYKSLDEYNTVSKQTELYKSYILDDKSKDFFIATMSDTLGYHIEPQYLFSELANAVKDNSFELVHLKNAFVRLETAYKQFEGLFDDIDLDSKQLGVDANQRNITISEVIIGDGYEYLIGEFAAGSGKKAGEFYTPQQVSDMMAQIVTIGQEDTPSFTVYDPTMGSGSLMLNVRKYLNNPDRVQYHGQELNVTTYNLARMNLILHEVSAEDQRLHNGDTLNKDWPTDEPYMFDSVVMNPPYSANWSADPTFMDDARFNRYGKLAPKSKADFAFLLHGFYHLKTSGTMAIVLPHGVLFRGAAEGTIRKKLLEDGSIYAVIGMPANLFFGTSIPTTVIIIKKNRKGRDVLFIDASNDYTKFKNQNKLEPEHIKRIVDTYKNRESIEKYAYLASFEEIKENDFNLNIPRYVDTFEEEAPIDMVALGAEMKVINEEESKLEQEIYDMLLQLECAEEDKEWLNGVLEVFNHEK